MAVDQAITSAELARHCRRRTRTPEEIKSLIEDLILNMTSMTDTLGVPVFKEEISNIWALEKKHVRCLEDPDFPLYTITRQVTKGGQLLPVYRCARGTTSLESFHLHINTFIPGQSANAVHFQAYLLDGVTRWNTARKEAAEKRASKFQSYDSELIARLNDLHTAVHGTPLIDRDPPSKYTGEAFGVEFLYKQCHLAFSDEVIDSLVDDVLAAEIDVDSATWEDVDFKELPGVEELLQDVNAEDFEEGQQAEDEETVTFVIYLLPYFMFFLIYIYALRFCCRVLLVNLFYSNFYKV